MKTLLLFALTALALPASARVGETLDEIKARYGETREEAPRRGRIVTFCYRFRGVPIDVEFLDGRSVRETFRYVTSEDAQGIMKSWSAGKAWQLGRNLDKGLVEHWFAKLVAVLDNAKGTLTLTTRDGAERLAKAATEDPAGRTVDKGF